MERLIFSLSRTAVTYNAAGLRPLCRRIMFAAVFSHHPGCWNDPGYHTSSEPADEILLLRSVLVLARRLPSPSSSLVRADHVAHSVDDLAICRRDQYAFELVGRRRNTDGSSIGFPDDDKLFSDPLPKNRPVVMMLTL